MMVNEILDIAAQAREDCEGLEIPYAVNVQLPNPDTFTNEQLTDLMVVVEAALTRMCMDIRDGSHALVSADVDYGPEHFSL
jgi:hypothetical protein